MLWINQRLDGTTPEFYSRNWYVHGGHLDGHEAESDTSRAYQERHYEVMPAAGTSRTGCSSPSRPRPGSCTGSPTCWATTSSPGRASGTTQGRDGRRELRPVAATRGARIL